VRGDEQRGSSNHMNNLLIGMIAASCVCHLRFGLAVVAERTGLVVGRVHFRPAVGRTVPVNVP